MRKIGTAGVLRLRAIRRPLCDRSARRFAQDDGFVGAEKLSVSCVENTKDQKKSQALRMSALWGLKRFRFRCVENTKDQKKVSGSQDDGFVGILTKNILTG